jgi:predicted nucleic acid-binding protein
VNFLFDTNIYFAAIHDPGFLARHHDDLLRMGPRTFLSSVVRSELLQGAQGDLGRARVSRATQHLERAGRVVPPTHDDWVTAGTIQGRIWDNAASLRSKRLLHDILIVCAARRIGAIVITDNARDFDLIRRYLPHHALSMSEVAQSLSRR